MGFVFAQSWHYAGLVFTLTVPCVNDLEMIGFIHSHPEPPQGTYNDFPSAADLNLHILPGINNVYVVPYTKDDSNVPDVFAARDFSSWYFSNHTPHITNEVNFYENTKINYCFFDYLHDLLSGIL